MTDDPNEASILTEERLEAIRHLGYPDPPELLVALALATERGHNLGLVAAEGSGKELLFGLAAALRCDPDAPGLQALILTPTREAALRAASAAHALGGREGLACLAWPPIWPRGSADAGPGDDGAEMPFAQVLAGRPQSLLAEARAGRLTLGDLRLLVLDGVEALAETGARESVEALLESLNSEAQRIACAASAGPPLEELLERRLPRARRWPAELLAAPGTEAAASPAAGEGGSSPLWYATGVGEAARLGRLAAGLRRLAADAGEETAFVHCPDEATAHRAAAYLAASGLRLAGDEEAPGVAVAWGEDEPSPRGVAALLGLPLGLEGLLHWLANASVRLAVVEERHLPQLRLLARRAGWPTRALPADVPAHLQEELASFRNRVEARVRRADLAVELLLLEPLLEELGDAPVTAALASLLRESLRDAPAAERPEMPAGTRPPGRTAVRTPEDRSGRRPPRAPRRERREERGVRPAWTRIWVSVGERDGAGPGDLVGAITGETPAVGAQIGKIEVRTSYSLVDLDSQVVDEVLTRLEGAQIKGRDVHVRLAKES